MTANDLSMKDETNVLPRVCMVIESYSPVIGGMERQARSLAAQLAENHVRLQVVTRRTARDVPVSERIDGIPVQRIAPVGSWRGGRWIMAATVLPWLLRHRNEYDLIFVPGFRTLGLSAVLLRKVTGKPCVLKADSRGEMSGSFFSAGLSGRGLSCDGFLIRNLMALRQRILRRADAFVSMSSEMTAEFSRAGVDPSKIFRIPNLVDTTLFKPVDGVEKKALRRRFEIPPEATVFVYTGRLVTYKGLPVLLDAWKQFQRGNPSVMLWIVGGGGHDMHNCEAMLRSFVATHGLEQSVKFSGETRNVHGYLQASDVFVFPTQEEAFGLSLIEAMACGLPSISTDVGGIADFLRDGENAIAVTVGDVRSLVDAMRRFQADPSLRKALGASALEMVAAEFAPATVCRRYLDLFLSVQSGDGINQKS